MTAVGSTQPDVQGRRSDGRGAIQLGAHVGALLVLGALVELTSGSALVVPVIVVYGVVLVFLFCAVHECVHRTAFRSPWIADVVAASAGALLLLPSRWFRFFHAAHHRYTQDPDRDPELVGAKPLTRRRVVLHAFGLTYWTSAVAVLARLAVGRSIDEFVPARHRRKVVFQARLLVALYAAVAVVSVLAGSTMALRLWVLPAMIGQPFLRGLLLAEHDGCPLVNDPMRNTRTTITNAVVRRLAWNMPFHAEHHAQPSVPFHQLPQLHDTLVARLETVGGGYVRTYVARQRARWRVAATSGDVGA
jgi:fatty acid desaturase